MRLCQPAATVLGLALAVPSIGKLMPKTGRVYANETIKEIRNRLLLIAVRNHGFLPSECPIGST